MNAVVTVAMGPRSSKLADLTAPIMQAYARRCNCDFIILKEPKVNAGDNKFEKLQIYDILEKYDRVSYFDVDIIVMPNCPNLFSVVRSGLFGAYFDSNGGNGDAELGWPDIRGEEIASYQRLCGEIGWKKTYFNSGVMVVDKMHREMFQYKHSILRSTRFVDQTMLNFRLQKCGVAWQDIGPKFNHFAGFNHSDRLFKTRFYSWIIHYAGFEEFYSSPSLEEQIRSDLRVIYPSLLG